MLNDTNKKRTVIVLGKGGGGQAESVEWDDILNKPNFATVATSGDYDDLNDKPTILTQWFGTQAEYDAIATKDPNTIYNIEGGAKEDLDLSTLTQAQYVDFYTNYNTYKANYDLNWGGLPILSINSWQPDASISPVPVIVVQYGIYGQSALMTGGDDEVYFGVQLIAADGSVINYSSSMIFKQICHTASYNDLVDKPRMATETLTFTLQGGTTQTVTVWTQPTI